MIRMRRRVVMVVLLFRSDAMTALVLFVVLLLSWECV